MQHTKFEKARIIGARALQISMGAPVIIDIPRNVIDPVDIALMEYENDVIPITVRNN
ncbi:DNA-directed RNA polymerase subunit K [Caldiplasma sukawensis]